MTFFCYKWSCDCLSSNKMNSYFRGEVCFFLTFPKNKKKNSLKVYFKFNQSHFMQVKLPNIETNGVAQRLPKNGRVVDSWGNPFTTCPRCSHIQMRLLHEEKLNSFTRVGKSFTHENPQFSCSNNFSSRR